MALLSLKTGTEPSPNLAAPYTQGYAGVIYIKKNEGGGAVHTSITNKLACLKAIQRLALLLLLCGFASGASAGYNLYCQNDSDVDAVGVGPLHNIGFVGPCAAGEIVTVICFYSGTFQDPSCDPVPHPHNDNCPAVANTNQLDTDLDGVGDACQGAAQTITITTAAPVVAANSSTFPVAATASSGLPVVITTTGGCSIAGGIVTMNSATTACTVKFNTQWSAASGYATAPELKSITKVTQSITVTTPAPSSAANTSYFTVAATASSGLAVAVTVSGGCTIASGVVTITSDVTPCVVNYNQIGNANWDAAPQVTSTTTVNAGVAQFITATPPAPMSAEFNSTFPVAAIASSGLPVVIAVSGNCALAAGIVTLGSGNATCSVSYRQAGNAIYSAAPLVTSVTVPSLVVVNPVHVAAGEANTCALDSAGVHCWGYNLYGEATVPALLNPIQVAVGALHTCALDSTGVHCWGYNGSGQTTVPALVNPVKISAGGNTTCALDSTGVHCWGYNGNGQTVVPVLVNPVQISAGAYHTCALDDTGVHCWGGNSSGQTVVPVLVNPTQVSAGEMHTCALDNTGVHCWGDNNYGQRIVPALINPVQVSAGGYHTCALDISGVHCWGRYAEGQTTVPALSYPSQVSAGRYHTCAIDSTGVHCWGDNTYNKATSVAAVFGATSQIITVTTPAPASAIFGSTFPVAATASSGLPVAITVSGGCSIASGVVTMTSATMACTLKFNQFGNTTYGVASQVTSNTAALALSDIDGDGVADNSDNCPLIANSNQLNLDADAFGDVCDGDIDGDGVPNGIDANPLSAANAVELKLPLDGTHKGARINEGLIKN